MPKRTTPFQRLVARMYEQMASPDDRIVESASLKERDCDTPREIDVLLTKTVFGIEIRIAVETRERTAKDDITWIDELVGKYQDLAVDKIVAVSESGFSKGATDKAAANQIATLTLAEALETSWPEEFVKLGFATSDRFDAPYWFEVLTDPPLTAPPPLSAPLTSEGSLTRTLEQVAHEIYNRREPTISVLLRDQFLELFRTLGDLKTKALFAHLSIATSKPVFLDLPAEPSRRVLEFRLCVRSFFSVETVPLRHHLLGRSQVTVGTVTDRGGQQTRHVTMIQVAGKPDEARIWFDAAPPDASTQGLTRPKDPPEEDRQ